MERSYDKFELILDTLKKIDLSRIFTEKISFPEFMQLKYIKYLIIKYNKNNVRVSELVDNSCVTAQAISKCLRVMESKKLIIRYTDRNDRRITLVEITNEGNQILETTESEVQSLMEDVFSNFSAEEIKKFEFLTDKFVSLYSSAIDRRSKL